MKSFAVILMLLVLHPCLAQPTLSAGKGVESASSVTGREAGQPPAETPRGSTTAGDFVLSPDDVADLRLIIATDDDNAGRAQSSLASRRDVLQTSLQRAEALPRGSDEYFGAVRRAMSAGYFYIWSILDNQQVEASKQFLAKLHGLLDQYDRLTPPPPISLVLSLAQLHWLEARAFEDWGDPSSSKEAGARVLMLTENPDVNPGDFVPLARLRVQALWISENGTAIRKAREDACALAQDIYEIRPNEDSSLARIIDCGLEDVRGATKDRDFNRAKLELEHVRAQINSYLGNVSADMSMDIRIKLVAIELAAKDIAVSEQKEQEVVRDQLAAVKLFTQILRGRSIFQNNRWEISDYFDGVKDLDLTQLPEFKSSAERDQRLTEIYLEIADAVEVSRLTYPTSPSYAIVAGEALARVAGLHLKTQDLRGADDASARSVAIFKAAHLILGLRTMNERAESECSAYSGRISILVAMQRVDDALQAYSEMNGACGQWVRRYPWEFYARQHIVKAARSLGVLLHQQRRYSEALPLLRYASDWGDRNASLYLADMSQMGHGVTANPSYAVRLQKLGTQQSMKRFTVPTDFGGVKVPFYVYVQQFRTDHTCEFTSEPLDLKSTCTGYAGIDDQVLWVKELRGGIIPKDVVESFQKLAKIARENDLSLPDLAVYALGDRPDQPATPRAETAMTNKPPTVTSTAFAAVDTRESDKPLVWQTRVVPLRPETSCLAWTIDIKPESRTVELREDYLMPAAPAHLGATNDAVVTDGGRRVISTLRRSLANGMVSNERCVSAGDPLGVYKIAVFSGDTSLLDVEFQVVPDSDTAAPGTPLSAR